MEMPNSFLILPRTLACLGTPSFPPLFQESYQAKSSPSHIFMACMNYEPFLCLLPMSVALSKGSIGGILTFLGFT